MVPWTRVLAVEAKDTGELLDGSGQWDLPVVVMGWTGRGVAGRDNIVERNESFPRMRKIEEESGLWVRFRFSFEAQF